MKFAFHPPLVAIHPVLVLFASNVSLVPLSDVWLPCALSAAGVCVAWVLVALTVRNARRAAAFTSVVAFGFFQYGAVEDLVNPTSLVGPKNVPTAALVAFWSAAVLAVAWLVAFKPKDVAKLTLLLNVVGVLACGFALASGAFAISGSHNALRARGGTLVHAAPQSPPDVFYIVLDGFGRADVLTERYGATSPTLEEELAKRGFFVAREAHSNYVQTQISLASSMNCAFVPTLVATSGDADGDRLALDALIDDSLVGRALRSIGYKEVAVTTGFPALEFSTADQHFQGDGGRNLFIGALLDKTPFRTSTRLVRSQFDQRRAELDAGFDALTKLAKRSASPRFVVAHILAPHPPFVFGPNGEPRRPKGGFVLSDGSHFVGVIGTAEEYRNGYRDQMEYVKKRTLEAVDAILSQGGTRPIVLIQGDHGPKSGLDQESLDRTDVNEVFPILSAYYVPAETRARLYPAITPVNSFRVVLSTVFGADLPTLPDASCYSSWSKPLEFTDVTERLARRE